MNKLYLTIALVLLVSLLSNAQREIKSISNLHTGSITSVAINFNGAVAITAESDARANMWNTSTGRKIKGFSMREKAVTDVKYNQDETLFATAGKNMSTIIWDAITLKPKKILKESSEMLAIDFNPFNNELISVSASGNVRLWDAGVGRIVQNSFLELPIKDIKTASVLFSKNGKHIGIHANDKLFIFDYAKRSLLQSLDAFKNETSTQSFDFSPNGQYLVYKNKEGKLSLVNLGKNESAQNFPNNFADLSVISFAGNSQKLLLGSSAGKVYLYDIASKQITKEFAAHESILVSCRLSLDGKTLITAGSDNTLKRWDVSDWNLNFQEVPAQCVHNANLSFIILEDENQNGLLDAGENASISVTIRNNEAYPFYNAVIKLNQQNPLEGLEIPGEGFAGTIQANSEKKVNIPITISEKLAQGSTVVSAELSCMETTLGSKELALQAGSSVNAGLAISSYKFYSPSGKSTKGEPITMMINLDNVTRIAATNVLITYNFPPGVSAIDKAKEVVPFIGANSAFSTSVQFITDKNIAANEITLSIDISGVAYSNAKDIKMELPLNQMIGTQQDMLAMLESNITNDRMRGNLTVSRANLAGTPVEDSRFVALIIGIDEYKGTWNRLNNAARDAKAVEEVLKKQYNFSLVKTLYNEAASRQAIIGELEWMVANLKPSDNLLIYYSGHGDFKETLNRGFWVPADATSNSTSNFISNPDLQTFLGSIKAKHTLLISDACFSGDIFRGGSQSETAEVNEKYYSRVNSLVSRQAITSGGIEPVMDGGKDGHSVFAYYFLKALKENTQKYVDATQLFDAIKIPVVNNSSQAPKFSPIKNTGDEGGEFVFYKK